MHIIILTWIFVTAGPSVSSSISHTDGVPYTNRDTCVKAAHKLKAPKGDKILWWCKEKEGEY